MIFKLLLVVVTSVLFHTSTYASMPTLAYTFDTNVKIINMTRAQENKIRDAEEIIKDIVASDAFRRKVLGHTYLGKKTFVDNKGLTNSQIYYKILYGAEKLYPRQNNQIDMGVKLYTDDASITVGYTTPSISYININTKYFNKYTSSQVAHNMMHEWMHKIGFEHDVQFSPKRNYSVPYAIGKIILELAGK
jgi:hypothetical protein